MAVPGIGWAHGTAAANLVDFADKLRPGSKIPVSIGNGVNLFEADLAAKLTAEGAVDPNPGCKYQKTVNEGFTGRTDSDLLFGLQWMVPRSTRKWRDLRNYKSADQDITDWINTAFTQTGKKVTILITGPGTDVALALRTTPTLTQKIERIVWMGGAIDVPGNMFSLPANTVAEFNIFLDCVAAKELFSNPGLHITLVPLDFTNNLVLDAKFMTALQAAGQKTWEAKFAYELLDVNRDTWFGGETAFYQQYTIWDPLAAAVMFNQAGNVTFENMKIRQVCGTDLLGGILDITKDAQTVRELSPTYVGANVTVAKTLQKGATITDYPVVKNFLAALTA
ncbi:hypothetical protein HK104_008096 [Borealophlyctis nickersoniae]|nr:hypothetical protein HK104_008096 [Borealophlyctis nickersoniae]